MIYLDANASSQLRPAVRAAVSERLEVGKVLGNPSSIYESGRRSKAVLGEARRTILNFLFRGVPKDAQLFFTSGGSESCNYITTGFVDLTLPGHILSTAFEHPAILEPLIKLQRSGFELELLSPTELTPQRFVQGLRSSTALVAIMYANNETGAIQPVAEIASALRAAGYSGPIVSDITQAVGKTDIDLGELFSSGVSAVALSAHKLGALSGIGAVVLAGASYGLCFQMSPIILGGGQEQGFRSGTENILGIAAFAAAVKEISIKGTEERVGMSRLRDLLWEKVCSGIQGVRRLSPVKNVLPNTLLLHISDCRSDDLVVALDLLGVAASRGSACNSGKQNVSHVPLALGLSKSESKEVIRFSLDWDASEASILAAAEKIIRAVQQIRAVTQTELLEARA